MPNLLVWAQVVGYLLLALTVAPLFPFLYVVLRWRAEGRREPGIGTYGALLYFCTLSFLLFLCGAANLTYGAISVTPIQEELRRMSWGLLFGSLVFLVVNGSLVLRLKMGLEYPEARRIFAGFLTVLTGLVAFAAVIMLFVTLFKRVPPGREQAAVERTDEIRLYGVWTGYFLLTYSFTALRMSRAAARRR